LVLLFSAFPSGVNDDIKSLYLSQLQAQRADAMDLLEMAQRILHTRESRTVPPLAEILRRLSEARSDRLKGEYEEPQIAVGHKLTRPEKADVRVWRALSRRGVHHCDRRNQWVTGGYCGCHPGLCWGDGVTAADARARLDQAEAEGTEMPVRAGMRPPDPWAKAGDTLGSGKVTRMLGWDSEVPF